MGLFAGTLLAGGGVAVAQTALPVYIRTGHPARTGLLTGAFSMALPLGATLAAALAVPLEDALGSWEESLAAWSLLAVAAALVWLPREARTRVTGPVPPPLRRDGLAWAVSLYFGVQSMAFYIGLSWLPSILADAGYSDASAGLPAGALGAGPAAAGVPRAGPGVAPAQPGADPGRDRRDVGGARARPAGGRGRRACCG